MQITRYFGKRSKLRARIERSDVLVVDGVLVIQAVDQVDYIVMGRWYEYICLHIRPVVIGAGVTSVRLEFGRVHELEYPLELIYECALRQQIDQIVHPRIHSRR